LEKKILNKKIKSPIKKIKWGVAGCGNFAEHSFLPAVLISRRGKVTSIFSNNKQRAEQLANKFSISNYFSDFEKFLNSDIDAVYISSANINHYEQVVMAANAGKHILCEKPMSITSEQAKEMIDTCKKNNVQLSVNYVLRYHPVILKSKEIINSRMIGKLTSINMSFNINLPPSENYRYNKKLSGGGALRDLGTHLIDLLLFLGGEIEQINGGLDNLVYKEDVEDYAHATVKFKDSGYGNFNVSYCNERGLNRIEILGSKGAIAIDNFIGIKHEPSKISILLNDEAKRVFRKRGNKMLYMLRSVQKAFLKNKAPLVTGEDGYINLKLMEELERKCS